MLLDVLREIEDRTRKLGWCLAGGDTSQARTHNDEIRRLVIEAAVIVLRQDGGASGEQRARPQRRLSAAFAPDPD
jgi:hypothetical protein